MSYLFSGAGNGRGVAAGRRGGRGRVGRGRGHRGGDTVNGADRLYSGRTVNMGDFGYAGNRASESMDNFTTRNNVFFWAALVGAMRDNPEVMSRVFRDYDQRAAEFRRIRQEELARMQDGQPNDTGRTTTSFDNAGGAGVVPPSPFASTFTGQNQQPSGTPQQHQFPGLGVPGPSSSAPGNDGTSRDTIGQDDGTFEFSQDPYNFMNDIPESSEYLDLLNEMESDYNMNRRPGLFYLGKQTLSFVLDELDLDGMWNSPNYKSSFGSLTSKFVRLFSANYSTDYENFAIYMLQISMDSLDLESGSRMPRCDRSARTDENYVDRYRRRGQELYKFAAFRFYIETLSYASIISNKNKDDLVLLYMLLTIPDVSVYRQGSSDVHYEKYVHPLDGKEIKTASLLNRPFFINIRLDGIFGNLSRNIRKLERSINNASQNLKRKMQSTRKGHGQDGNSTDEIVSREISVLLRDATVLQNVFRPDSRETANLQRLSVAKHEENKYLTEMLKNTLIVSMMAEEFRVYMLSDDAVSISDNDGANSSNSRFSTNKRRSRNNEFDGAGVLRNSIVPVFYCFSMKPTRDIGGAVASTRFT